MNAITRTAMPSAIKDYLRKPEVAQRLSQLRKLSPWRFTRAALCNYLAIAAAIFSVTLLTTALADASSATTVAVMLPTWLIALTIIAARQHALLVLMHEGAHRTVSTRRATNDLLSELLCGAPLLISMRSYRPDHLTHHQHLNSAADPDWRRKTDDTQQRAQWQFPLSGALTVALAKLYGYSVTYLLNTLADNRAAKDTRANSSLVIATQTKPTDKELGLMRYAFYGCAAVALTLTGSWLGLVVFWLVPMFFVLPLIMRVRSIAEHFALRHNHPLTQSRTVRAGRLERALLAPHHIGLHIDHHLLASVPFYNLPALHELLLACPYYANHAHLNEGYFVRRRGAYPDTKSGIPVLPELNTLADDMYSQPSERLLAMN